jgi:hypothetical protein
MIWSNSLGKLVIVISSSEIGIKPQHIWFGGDYALLQ